MVSGWSDFSVWIISSFDEKESKHRKCCKLVENHPINQFLHEKSIENCFRMIWRIFFDHRFPWWERVRKAKLSLFPGNAGCNLLVLKIRLTTSRLILMFVHIKPHLIFLVISVSEIENRKKFETILLLILKSMENEEIL